MAAIQSTTPRVDLRFGANRSQRPASESQADLGASQVHSSPKDFPPGCLTGGASDVQSQGDFPPGCLFGGATDVTSSSKDFPPGCLTGGASDVQSQGDVGIGCLFGGSTDVTSGGSWNLAG